MVADRLTVACVKWGTLYGADYVLKLRNAVARNLSVPHKFVCITERPVDGVECWPLPCEYGGWWQKIGLFRPGLFDGPVLYLDLDVVIAASLDPLAAVLDGSDGLCARDDFSYSMRNPRRGLDAAFLRMLGGPGCVNSSVMLWRGDYCRDVWDKFSPAIMDEMHGDQNFISNVMRDRIRFIPDHLVNSYKYHVLRGEPPATICVYHGKPKPHEVSDAWVATHWR